MVEQQNASLSAIDVRGRKILVADIQPLNASDLKHLLRDEGYVFRVTGSGAKVLEVYPQFEPNLVLLHLAGGIDGLETCRKLKESYGE